MVNRAMSMFGYFLLFLSGSLVACSGGSGSGSGSSSAGSATFENFTASSSVSNICRNYSTPTDSASCVSAGGTWASRTAYTSSTGSLNGSYATVCSSGTGAVTCLLDNVSFTATAGINANSVAACTNAGGQIVVTCSASAGTENYCNIAVPNTYPNCSARGGTFYYGLQTLTGLLTDERIGVGTNTVNVVIDTMVDSVDPRTLNPQAPVYMTMTVRIRDEFNSPYWSSVQTLTTGSDFDGDINAPSFSLTSPVRIDEGLVHVDNAVLYFE